MNSYILKRSRVRAIQFTGDNREKIMDALDLKKEECEIWINEDTKESYLSINAKYVNGKVDKGYWVVIDGKKECCLVTEEFFKENYEEISE